MMSIENEAVRRLYYSSDCIGLCVCNKPMKVSGKEEKSMGSISVCLTICVRVYEVAARSVAVSKDGGTMCRGIKIRRYKVSRDY